MDRTWGVLFTGANLPGDVTALYGLGKVGMEVENFTRAGREIQLGNDFRIAHIGNRTGDPLDELPHIEED
jgi:sorbitol-specific phosphotransferase system component IIA